MPLLHFDGYMEKRLLLAVLLMAAAILFTQLLFPPPEPPTAVAPEGADSTAVAQQVAGAPSTPIPTVVAEVPAAAADTVVVTSDFYRYVFSTRGAALLQAELLEYASYRDPGSPVQLVPEGVTDFMTHRLALGSDTVDLRAAPFAVSREASGGGEVLTFRYEGANGFGLTLRYTFAGEDYLFEVDGQVDGIGGRDAVLLTEMGPGFEMHEDPQHRSEQQLEVVAGPVRGGVERVLFRRVSEPRSVDTPLAWAGIKDKYFLSAIIGGESPLSSASILPVASQTVTFSSGEQVEVPAARVTTVQPVGADGSVQFDVYIGPQDFGRLSAIGYDLEEVTPYGYRWLQPVIRPLAAAVLWVLNTLHDVLGIAYGWVLIIFGVLMRVVLWPLNAKAMRAQMKNMALQPLIQEIQEKYKNDPEKMREAMLAFTREHKFNPLGGCLPLLIPFPVLITLFFVFQNTIAFRGAEFLWLPDLSLRDPFYILPVLLVVSMFGLQLLSARVSGMEQNPQMKMMMYFMPLMMGFLFFLLPSGLNLYYVSTQFASAPQQLLIAKERRKAQEEMKKSGGKPSITPPKGGKRRSGSKR